MWELDYKESWAAKNRCFWTVVLEKTLESPLNCKEIQPVHPKGNQSWIFVRRTDAEAETPIFWPPNVENWLIGKDPDAGKDWRWEEKGMTEDEMVGWHHGLNGHEFEWTLGVGDGQGGLAGCSPWGHKESDTTEWLNWTKQNRHNYTINTSSITSNCFLVLLLSLIVFPSPITDCFFVTIDSFVFSRTLYKQNHKYVLFPFVCHLSLSIVWVRPCCWVITNSILFVAK